MKKFKFTIRGNDYDVQIKNIDDDVAEIEVNGSTYEVEIHKQKKSTKTPTLVRPKAVPSTDAAPAKTTKPNALKAAGSVTAPLPGTILEVKVRAGDTVNIGDTLLIMEAMKMENEIKSDKQGTISAVKVSQGSSVLEGEVLVEIGS